MMMIALQMQMTALLDEMMSLRLLMIAAAQMMLQA